MAEDELVERESEQHLSICHIGRTRRFLVGQSRSEQELLEGQSAQVVAFVRCGDTHHDEATGAQED